METHVYVHKNFPKPANVPGHEVKMYRKAWRYVDEMVAHQSFPLAKPTVGLNKLWLRTGLGGSHGSQWYLWWSKQGDIFELEKGTVVVLGIKHHDATGRRVPAPLREDLSEANPSLREERPYLTKEQERVGASLMSAVFVKGSAGTGKSVALTEATARTEGKHVLYVTLSRDLADWAQREVCAHRARPDGIEFKPLLSLYRDWAGLVDLPADLDRAEIAIDCRKAFLSWLNNEARLNLGDWARHREMLYDTLYHTVGGDNAQCATPDGVPRSLRNRLMQDNLGSRFFPAPALASRLHEHLDALGQKIQKGNPWDVVFIDELQDLTPVELNLFGGLRKRLGFRLVVAGDENQTVWPTGFQWDTAASLLVPDGQKQEILLNDPLRYSGDIHACVETLRALKKDLIKSVRPGDSVNKVNASTESPSRVHWISLPRAPERVDFIQNVLKVTSRCRAVTVMPPEDATEEEAGEGEGPLDCQEAKGLDWPSLLLLDLGKALVAFKKQNHNGGEKHDKVAEHAARHILDRMVVGASRASEHLVIVDSEEDESGERRALEEVRLGMRQRGVTNVALQWETRKTMIMELNENLPTDEKAKLLQQEILGYLKVPNRRPEAVRRARHGVLWARREGLPKHFERLLAMALLLYSAASRQERDKARQREEEAEETLRVCGQDDLADAARNASVWWSGRKDIKGGMALKEASQLLEWLPRGMAGAPEVRLLARELQDDLGRWLHWLVDNAKKVMDTLEASAGTKMATPSEVPQPTPPAMGENLWQVLRSFAHRGMRTEALSLMKALIEGARERANGKISLQASKILHQFLKRARPDIRKEGFYRFDAPPSEAEDPDAKRMRSGERAQSYEDLNLLNARLCVRERQFNEAADWYKRAKNTKKQVECLRRGNLTKEAIKACKSLRGPTPHDTLEWLIRTREVLKVPQMDELLYEEVQGLKRTVDAALGRARRRDDDGAQAQEATTEAD